LGLPAWTSPQSAPRAAADAATEEGIPVENSIVRTRCRGCHRADDKGRMTRISYRRATPENWERTIKRMMSLNHVTLSPDDARAILRYLATTKGSPPRN
jgi:quinohemoprotein amine dehydrogenase